MSASGTDGASAREDAVARELRAHVFPEGWKNPRPRDRYDLVVLGAGTAGLVSAMGAAGLGARVALVEKTALGGDCLNTGCVPSKALLRAARAVAEVRRAGELGIRVPGEVVVDFAAVMERVRRVRAGIAPHDSVARFAAAGVDVFLGAGRFRGPDALEVAGETLRFRRAVVATGARPALPPIPGLASLEPLTSETVFELRELPRRLAVLGGGPIGCELAQAFARLGSRVTLVQRAPRLLEKEDPDAAAVVEAALARDGVEVLLGARVASARREGGEARLVLEGPRGRDGGGAAREIAADRVLVAAGRVPNVAGLGLEAAGVAFDARGVRVDDFLATTNARIYAAGDVASAFQFTHAADALARIVLRNALFPGGAARASALVIPWCTYTEPELARVGLSQEEARARGVPFRAFEHSLRDLDRAITDGETEGFARVLVEEGSDRILGATLVASRAGESISEVALALTKGLGLGAVGATVHPYPTGSEAWKRCADAHARSRLTPLVRRLLARWFQWTR